MDYKEIRNCRVCGSASLKPYLEFPNSPLANKLVTQESPDSNKYPIKLLFCEECALSQLSVVVDPTIMFENYVYHSSISETFKKHCYDMAVELKEMYRPVENKDWLIGEKPMPTVLDIASNDGCLLEQFQMVGYGVLGIEPSKNLSDMANEKLLMTIPEYFSEKVSMELFHSPSNQRSFVTATNVLAHVDDINDFLLGVKHALRQDGTFVCEVPYLPNLINGNQFDTVYHEHLSYFLLGPLVRAFEKAGLHIFRVKEVPIHGGSLRIYAGKDNRQMEQSVEAYLDYEEMNGFYDYGKYLDFWVRDYGIGDKLLKLLRKIKEEGKIVVAYGAAAKGISFLNYFGISNKLIHSIVDETPAKWDKLAPGSLIPIVPFEAFEKIKPDYILLLAWNFKEELMRKTAHLGAKHIIAIPQLEVI